jgi:hypothetical protein
MTTKYDSVKKKYHVNRWNPTKLTAKHLCNHIHSGITPAQLTRVHPEDEGTPILSIAFNVAWNSAWVTESDLLHLPDVKIAIDKYMLNKAPLPQKKRTIPPAPPPKASR